MSKTIVLEIPDQTFDALLELAIRDGQSAEGWLVSLVERVADDPLMKLAGTLETGVPDLADRDDDYLGQHLQVELRDEEP